jgi:hypothetical protein
MKKLAMCLVLLIAVCPAFAQKAKTTAKPAAKPASSALTDVHLFQSFFHDAPVAKSPFVQPTFGFASSSVDYGKKSYTTTVMDIGAMGAIPAGKKFDIGAEVYFENMKPEEGDGESGLTDLDVYGKYNFKQDKKQILSGGASISLPIGKEELGYSAMNFGFFGAYRTLLASGMVITANAGLNFIEVASASSSADAGDLDDFDWADLAKVSAKDDDDTDRETCFRIGGGIIYPLSNKKTSLVGEMVMVTEVDFMMLSAGAAPWA